MCTLYRLHINIKQFNMKYSYDSVILDIPQQIPLAYTNVYHEFVPVCAKPLYVLVVVCAAVKCLLYLPKFLRVDPV
jgi:hypothetical protein